MNADELEKLRQKILQIKHTRLILDPFPEHSEHGQFSRLGLKGVPPKEVSIWEAYKKGYEQAYKEILENLK